MIKRFVNSFFSERELEGGFLRSSKIQKDALRRLLACQINLLMPAGISLAEGEYHTRNVYHKSTKWIYIIAKGTC